MYKNMIMYSIDEINNKILLNENESLYLYLGSLYIGCIQNKDFDFMSIDYKKNVDCITLRLDSDYGKFIFHCDKILLRDTIEVMKIDSRKN